MPAVNNLSVRVVRQIRIVSRSRSVIPRWKTNVSLRLDRLTPTLSSAAILVIYLKSKHHLKLIQI